MPKKRMPVGESRQETAHVVAAPPSGRVTKLAGYRVGSRALKGALTWTGEPLKAMRTYPSEPEGKLDTSW